MDIADPSSGWKQENAGLRLPTVCESKTSRMRLEHPSPTHPHPPQNLAPKKGENQTRWV